MLLGHIIHSLRAETIACGYMWLWHYQTPKMLCRGIDSASATSALHKTIGAHKLIVHILAIFDNLAHCYSFILCPLQASVVLVNE